MPRSHVHLAAAVLSLTLIGFGVLGLLLLRRVSHRTAGLPSGPPSARPLPRHTTPFEEQLRAAADWDRRAREEVNQERERVEGGDSSRSAWVNGDAWREQMMAEDHGGYVARSWRAALRAAALAQTPEQRYRSAHLLVVIEHESGQHEAELRHARILVAVHPRSEEAQNILRRALLCAETKAPSTRHAPPLH
jgi:hypothetical protein